MFLNGSYPLVEPRKPTQYAAAWWHSLPVLTVVWDSNTKDEATEAALITELQKLWEPEGVIKSISMRIPKEVFEAENGVKF